MSFKIDGREITPRPDQSILDVAAAAGIDIPTLCHRPGSKPLNTCMVCLVADEAAGRTVSACSYAAGGNADIRTDTEQIQEARRAAVELLLSEHRGDCEAPCTRSCPAHMDIPVVISLLEEQKPAQALEIVHRRIALPEILGWICPAPCEKACRRGSYDSSVPICLLERHAAEAAPRVTPQLPERTGYKVAVIGAGPTGLSAAFFLRRVGHQCEVFDANRKPGGALRYSVPQSRLPRSVLDREIQRLADMGITLTPQSGLGDDFTAQEVCRDFDAVVVATGGSDTWTSSSERDPGPNLFVCANTTRPSRTAVQAGAHGHNAALAVNQYLLGQDPPPRRFDSRLGRLSAEELMAFVRTSGRTADRVAIEYDHRRGLETDAVTDTARRCLRCDCVAKEECRLRETGQQLGADARAFSVHPSASVAPFARQRETDGLGFELGKCIRCGRCVQIAVERGAPMGMTFTGRGYDMRVGPTFGQSVAHALGTAADECVASCPTGALFRRPWSEV